MAIKKPFVLSVTVFIVAFFSYFTYNAFIIGIPTTIAETFGFTIYHAVLDAAIIFVVAWLLMR